MRQTILTYQNGRVLVGRVKGTLAFPLYHLVLQDGQQVGILEFLKGGRGWGPRTPGSHLWEGRGRREEGNRVALGPGGSGLGTRGRAGHLSLTMKVQAGLKAKVPQA